MIITDIRLQHTDEFIMHQFVYYIYILVLLQKRCPITGENNDPLVCWTSTGSGYPYELIIPRWRTQSEKYILRMRTPTNNTN